MNLPLSPSAGYRLISCLNPCFISPGLQSASSLPFGSPKLAFLVIPNQQAICKRKQDGWTLKQEQGSTSTLNKMIYYDAVLSWKNNLNYLINFIQRPNIFIFSLDTFWEVTKIVWYRVFVSHSISNMLVVIYFDNFLWVKKKKIQPKTIKTQNPILSKTFLFFFFVFFISLTTLVLEFYQTCLTQMHNLNK